MKNFKINLFLILVIANVAFISSQEDDENEVTIEIDESDSFDVPYESPKISDPSKVYFAEHFDDPSSFEKKWVRSEAKKEDISEDIAKYDGEWKVEEPQRDGLFGDKGLVLKTQAKHAAISANLDRPFVFKDKPLIVQYEVTLQDGQTCGGSYLKLLSKTAAGPLDLKQFRDRTPYSIMFGPDKCGSDYKLHFIFNHRNPLNGTIGEKHCKKPKDRLENLINDKFPHLFRLVLNPDNTFAVSIDNKEVNSGSLLEDFEPAVNPPAEIEDPNDKKPADWDEREQIPDPSATKPDDWDEDAPSQIVDESATKPSGWLDDQPEHVPDPDAKKPEDWDSEMDGEWEPPLIDNPACANAPGCGPWEPPLIANPNYRGKWRAPMIDNPNYKGKWRPKLVPNPDYYEDKKPFAMASVGAVGFELWSMSKDMLFDNLIITEEIAIADQWTAETFEKKRQKIAKDSESVVDKLANLTVEYPILWGVYILVLGIPVVLVLYCCCRSGDTKEIKSEAEKKKTDEPTEDEPSQEVEEEEEESGKEDPEEKAPKEVARKRKVRKE